MKRKILTLLLLLLPTLVWASPFATVQLAQDGRSLSLVDVDGQRVAAPVLADQTGFAAPQVSPDGRYVGWLALYPNCCTSYDIPLMLVVVDADRRIRRFEGSGQAIFAWCFTPGSAAVAYMQTVLHGSNHAHFAWHSLRDGRRLARYDYPDEPADNAAARKAAPPWVQCVPQ